MVRTAGVHLVGGGWAEADRDEVYGPFLAEAGPDPVVACVVLDEGDGAVQAARWTSALTATARCRPRPVLVPQGSVLDPAALDGVDGVLVCGGLTPAYADSLVPLAGELRERLAGVPYLGFSAGAAVSAARAVLGGWRTAGRPVCPEDAAEDLDEVRVADGLGLVPFAVDVHAAQWGTLGRLVAAVGTGLVRSGVALDEGTALRLGEGVATVRGSGAAHSVRTGRDGTLRVRSFPAGASTTVGDLVG